MQSRIRAFDNVYRERLLVRLFVVGPGQEDDHRAMLAEFQLPRPPLVRLTNRHHLLPAAKLDQWWAATTAEERDGIMAEYEAGEAWSAVEAGEDWPAVEADEAWSAVAEYQDDLPEDDEERNAGVLYFKDFNEVAAIFLE
jgi:hypothetical protein